MDKTEKIAKSHLLSMGYNEDQLTFEPDGNIPPDFSVNGDIAVEVRRLDIVTKVNGNWEGLNQATIPLWNLFLGVLGGFAKEPTDPSWYIYIEQFPRPLPKKKTLQAALKKTLSEFLSCPCSTSVSRTVMEGVSIKLIPVAASLLTKKPNSFLMGGLSDEASDHIMSGTNNLDAIDGEGNFAVDGTVLEQMHSNIIRCSLEKHDKVARYRARYKEWWLILVDHIGYFLDDQELSWLQKDEKIEHTWDKLLVVNPNRPQKAISI